MAIELSLTPTFNTSRRYWGIVLAGGEGKRLKHFIKSTFGKECPKQFCAIVGNRSMFRHTIDRARLLISDERLFTVVNREHLVYAMSDIQDRASKNVVVIPCNRETAPSILLPLLNIYKNDPNAVVAVFPSDHFVLHENLFIDHIATACEFVEAEKDRIVVMGIASEKAHHGYGWIKKGSLVRRLTSVNKLGEADIYRATRFLEKPSGNTAQKIFLRGWLVNTMILVGKAVKFLSLFKEHTPELYSYFLPVLQGLGTPAEAKTIDGVFQLIPTVNFSKAILEHMTDSLCVMPMNNVYWNDWGEEQRVRADLEMINFRSRGVTLFPEMYKKEQHHYTIELSV